MANYKFGKLGDSRLGFGAAGAWGKKWFSESKAASLIEQAIAGGVVHFDTAGFYGHGEAERRLGAALKQLGRADVFVSTKTGTRLDRRGRSFKDFSPEGIRSDVETSLTRLDRECLDLLYLHGPDKRQIYETRAIMVALKEEGKIARIGICGEGEALDHAVDSRSADVIMGVYNFLRKEHADVFDRARQNNIGVVAIAPLAQGLYRRDLFFPRSIADGWHMARALVKNRRELSKARSEKVRVAMAKTGLAPAQAALAFVLAKSSVDIAMTTTTKPRHLEESLCLAGAPPSAELIKSLVEIS